MKKFIKPLCFAAPFLFTLPSSHAGDDWRFETQLTSYSVSELVPIKSLMDDSWSGEYQATNSLFTTNRGDIAIGKGKWLVGVSNRFDYFGRFSEDTGRFFYLDKNKIEQPENQDLDIYLNVEHAESHGAFVQYNDSYKNFDYAVRINYWHSQKTLSGIIDGKLNTNVDEKYTGELNFDYNYDEDTLFDRLTPDYVDGYGYSLDIDLFWQINDKFDASLSLKDVAHRIKWKEVYHTTASLNRTKDKEASEPSLSGIENNPDYTQRFKQQSYLQIGYKTDYGRAYGGTDHINTHHHVYVGFEREVFDNGFKASIALYPDTSSVKFGLGNDLIGFKLGLNKSKFKNANTLMLDMYFKY